MEIRGPGRLSRARNTRVRQEIEIVLVERRTKRNYEVQFMSSDGIIYIDVVRRRISAFSEVFTVGVS